MIGMNRWARSHGCTGAEMAILRALLPSHDQRSRPLFMQAADAPEVRRRAHGQRGYVLTFPYVKRRDYLVDVDEDLVSPTLTVREARTGRPLSFHVRVLRGGFLNQLTGIAEDGRPWPRQWEVTIEELARALVGMPMDWLPPELTDAARYGATRALAAWCGMAPDALDRCGPDVLTVKPSASREEIAEAERRLGFALPGAYREFVLITNGIAVRGDQQRDIFGTRDIHDAGFGARTFLVTTLDDGAVTMSAVAAPAKAVVAWVGRKDEHRAIGALQDHVQETLSRLEGVPAPRPHDLRRAV